MELPKIFLDFYFKRTTGVYDKIFNDEPEFGGVVNLPINGYQIALHEGDLRIIKVGETKKIVEDRETIDKLAQELEEEVAKIEIELRK